MAVTASYRPTREWPLLVLALAVVGSICVPLHQLLRTQGPETTANRLDRLLLQHPEQIACYCCFAWAGFILLGRYLEVRRQRKALTLGLLPTDEGACILHEDARPLLRKIEQVVGRGGPYILANMIRLALGKYSVSRNTRDVGDTVRLQAEVDQGRLVASMATPHYLVWAIPALGFLGTVRGLALVLSMAGGENQTLHDFITQVQDNLGVAFNCTLVALALSLPLMFLIYSVQRDEESLVLDCQQYCLEHMVNRLYEAEPGRETQTHINVMKEGQPVSW